VDDRQALAAGEVQEITRVLEHTLGLVGSDRSRGDVQVEVVALHVDRDDDGAGAVEDEQRVHPGLVLAPVLERDGWGDRAHRVTSWLAGA
jgi:hypothetical protein